MAKPKRDAVFDEIDAMFAPPAEPPQQVAAAAPQAVPELQAQTPSLDTTPVDAGQTGASDDPFAEIDAMIDGPQQAGPAQPQAPTEDPNNLTKKLQGFVTQNVLDRVGITGEGGLVPMAQQLMKNAYLSPGEVTKDPVAAILGAGTGIAEGGADLLDTLVNMTAAAGDVKDNPLLNYMKLGPLGGSIKAAKNVQQLLGGPMNLRQNIEDSMAGKLSAERAPNITQLSQSIPMALATITAGGGGLAGRAALGAGQNLAQGTLSNMNRQVQAGEKIDPGAAFNKSKGAGWLGGILAGAIGRRGGHGGEVEAAPLPKSEIKVTTGTGNQLPIHQPWAPTLEQIETAKAARKAGPKRDIPHPHNLDFTPSKEGGKYPDYLDFSQRPKAKLTNVTKPDKYPNNIDFNQSPKKYPDYLDFSRPKDRPQFKDVTKPGGEKPSNLFKPAETLRVSDFATRIKKGGDLAHTPGKPGFKRAKGPQGQSTNKAELVDSEGQPVIGDNGKPVSYSWKSLDDVAKPKHVPEKVMREYERIKEEQPPKAPEPEPPAKQEPVKPDNEVIQEAKTQSEKLAGKQAGIQKNLEKLERGDVKEQMKLNKKTGEMESTEVRAARAKGYVERLQTQRTALDNALKRYEEAVNKVDEPTSGGADYAKAALQGLKELMENLTKEETGGGDRFYNPIGSPLVGGIWAVMKIAKKADLGEAAMTQHWSGFAAKVERNLGTFFKSIKDPKERMKIADEVKGSIGLMNDFDIIQKYDAAGLSVDMSRHRAVLETLMYDAKLPETIAEREAFEKTRTMDAEEIITSKEIVDALGEEKAHWAAAVKQTCDGILDDIKARYDSEDISPEYKSFLKNYYQHMSGRTIKFGEKIEKTKFEKAAKYVKNAFYDNTTKGNLRIHSIHAADAFVHGGSKLGKHFWTGAMKAYGNKTVKDYVRSYKGSGLMKATRQGDSPTLLEKHIGGRLEKWGEKNKVVGEALKLGRVLEGGWLEGEKMHVLRAGILERAAVDMKIKGGAEALVNKIKEGTLSPEQVIELHSRQASLLNDIVGYNPSGILNRNAFQRQLGPIGSILQPFVGMRTVQSRLLYDNYAKAFKSGKIADLKQAALMHGLLLATGGSSALTRAGKLAIKAGLGVAALNKTEEYLDSLKKLPGITVSHLTPDVIPALFVTFDNMSHMAEQLGKFLENPAAAFKPENVKKQLLPVLGNTIGGAAGNYPSLTNIAAALEEKANADKGFKETAVFDDTAILHSKYVGKAKIGHYDNFDALLSFVSPHDIDKTHHAKELLIHRARALEDIEARYGPEAKSAATKMMSQYIKEHNEYPDWNVFADWAKDSFDNDEWRNGLAD